MIYRVTLTTAKARQNIVTVLALLFQWVLQPSQNQAPH